MYRLRCTARILVPLLVSLLLLTASIPGAARMLLISRGNGSVRFEGMIEAIGHAQWMIGRETVLVDDSTEIIEEGGEAQVGAWVWVAATWQADGNLRADWIRVELPAGAPGRMIEFTGLIEVIEEHRWVVGDVEVCITPETIIEGQPKVGVPASVRAQWLEECWQALEIAVYASMDEGTEVEFEGVIEAIGQSLWVVSGVAVEVDEDTTIVGEPEVGRIAEVTAFLDSDGRLWAEHILVLSEDDPQIVEFGGLISAIGTDRLPQEWEITRLEPGTAVSEVVVQVAENTLVDQSRAVATPGMWAEVTAYRENDGDLQARRIRIERPISVEVEGTLKTDTPTVPGWWRVDDQCVYVHAQTTVVGSPLPEMRLYVEGLMLGNGCIWAERVWPV